jgi:tetratricopeptide (TPR) repeat protein
MNALAVLCVTLAAAGSYGQAFQKANDAYEAGDYEGAAARYERLTSEGVVAPELFYNLGNAYYRSGHLGSAIANYERVLRLKPGSQTAKMNQDLCFRQTERRLAQPLAPAWQQSLLFWHGRVSPGAARILAILSWLSLWAILALRQWRPLPYTRPAALVAALLVAAFSLSYWAKTHPQPLAVASAAQVPVRYGTSDEETTRFELSEGDWVRVEDHHKDWSRVCTADGQRGWARRSDLTLVGPPYERAPVASGEVAGEDAS